MTGLSPEEAPVKYSSKNRNNRKLSSKRAGDDGKRENAEGLASASFRPFIFPNPSLPSLRHKEDCAEERVTTESASWSVIHLSQFFYVSLGDYSWNLDPCTNG